MPAGPVTTVPSVIAQDLDSCQDGWHGATSRMCVRRLIPHRARRAAGTGTDASGSTCRCAPEGSWPRTLGAMGPITSAAHAGRPVLMTPVERVTRGARPPRSTHAGRLRTLLAVCFLLAGCTTQSSATAVGSSADRDGLTLSAETTASSDSIVVETVVQNHGAGSVFLAPTQCGRVTEVVLARTILQPEGETWSGSLGALKGLVLEDQRMWQRPDPFAPRRMGDTSSDQPRVRATSAPARARTRCRDPGALGAAAIVRLRSRRGRVGRQRRAHRGRRGPRPRSAGVPRPPADMDRRSRSCRPQRPCRGARVERHRPLPAGWRPGAEPRAAVRPAAR